MAIPGLEKLRKDGERGPGETVNAEEALGALCSDNQYPIADFKILL